MRSRLLLLLALSAAGCGARSSLPEDQSPTLAGGLRLTQGTLTKSVSPVDRDGSVVAFYDYFSSSGHTGFEAPEKSELYFYRDTSTGILSLVTEHGIDVDTTGVSQPPGEVDQAFTGLPDGVTVAVSDDDKDPVEFVMDSPTIAQGTWTFNQNTDGGALSGFPFPGSWSVEVTSNFIEGIDAWRFFGPEEIPLDLTLPVTLTAYED
jgi:hypothetical protein